MSCDVTAQRLEVLFMSVAFDSSVFIVDFCLTEKGNALTSLFLFTPAGQRDSDEGVQRAGGALSRHGVRRRTRPVSRPDGALQNRREVTGH